MILAGILSLAFMGLAENPCEVKHDFLKEAVVLGVAQSLKNDRLMYCEWLVPDALSERSLLVYYTGSGGEVFAEKHLNFTQLEKPEFVQRDFRSGERREISKSAEGWQLIYQEDSDSKVKVTQQRDQDIDVIDAGFDNVIRANWNKLSQTETVEFDFASEVLQRTIELRVLEKSLKKCNAQEKEWRCFFVESSNPFLRMFTGELTLLYDEKKRLRRFEGAVNIRDAKQKKQKARINYFYRHSSE